MNDFNPDQFLATETSETFETIEPLLPEKEYIAVVEDVTGKAIQLKDGGEKPLLTIRWRLDDEEVSKLMANDNGLLADQKIWLTTIDGTAIGPLDPKHNQQLARLREAVGQNNPGQPWQPSMLIGQSARVIALSEDGDGDYEGRRFYRVKKVAAL